MANPQEIEDKGLVIEHKQSTFSWVLQWKQATQVKGLTLQVRTLGLVLEDVSLNPSSTAH